VREKESSGLERGNQRLCFEPRIDENGRPGPRSEPPVEANSFEPNGKAPGRVGT